MAIAQGDVVTSAGSDGSVTLPDIVALPRTIWPAGTPKMTLPVSLAGADVAFHTAAREGDCKSFRMVLPRTLRVLPAWTLPSSPKAMMTGFCEAGPCWMTLPWISTLPPLGASML